MHFRKKNPHVWEKMPIEGAIHLRSHSIPLSSESAPSQNPFKKWCEFSSSILFATFVCLLPLCEFFIIMLAKRNVAKHLFLTERTNRCNAAIIA